MKKVIYILVLLVTALVLVACGSKEYEIAMITDSGDIDDRSFNQGTWEGITEFAIENDLSYKYYKPTEVSFDAYVAAIELAVDNGAKIVVTPGFLFENSVHKAQTLYPDVKFVLIDGSPHNVNNWGTMGTYDGTAADFTVEDNTLSIFFQEEQSGFLAGYATVKDGFESLGFVGGMAVPAVVRFGMGFVAGAYYAAEEMDNMSFEFDETYYQYLNSFAPDEAHKTLTAGWYSAGVEVIHAAAGGAGNSVMAAAQDTTGKWVVGVDVDQSNLSPKVVTSAMKGLATAVQSALQDYVDDAFVGGISITLGAAEDGIGLPTVAASWRFATFTVANYDTIFAKLANGTVDVPNDHLSSVELSAFLVTLGFTPSQALLDKIVPPAAS
ncbi:MAG: BMP family ABC transporter substrate-binding protein [Firmicutes bacterium]|nr:BMP family ABC transporter substrate-binding protein [Bacillota bacterium]